MKLKVTAILAFALFFALANSSIAQVQNQDVSSSLEVLRVTTNNNGEEVIEQITSVQPGDTLEYRLTYTNNLAGAISNLQANLPIPVGVQYLENTANPAITTASLDASGDNFQTLPIQREVTLDNGQVQQQEVPAREYRRLRWAVSTLAAQESTTLTARVRVIDASSL